MKKFVLLLNVFLVKKYKEWCNLQPIFLLKIKGSETNGDYLV